MHEMSPHVERWEMSVGLRRATLKEENTSIASFLDYPLVLAAQGCISCYSPAETESRTAALIKEHGATLVVLSYSCV